MISGWEYEFGEYQMGRISEEEFNIHAKRQVYRAIDVGLAWQQYKNTAPSAFADFMEHNIVNSE